MITVQTRETEAKRFEHAEAAMALLQTLFSKAMPTTPTIVNIELANGDWFNVGINAPTEGFIQYIRNGGEPPYLVTKGVSSEGSVDFLLLEEHHTEIPREHMVGAEQVLATIRCFLEKGEFPEDIEWIEI